MSSKRSRFLWLAAALAASRATASAQATVPPTGPVADPAACRGGPIRRACRHLSFSLHDKLIGYPENFVEPPFGAQLNENLAVMISKGNVHDFLLYHSDFADGTATLTPAGAQRLSLMAARLPGWLGAVIVEWTPERPDLAQSRRDAVLALLNEAGLPIVAERVVVGPSPYPGIIGANAANNFDNLLYRNQAAPRSFPLPPTPTATFEGNR